MRCAKWTTGVLALVTTDAALEATGAFFLIAPVFCWLALLATGL